MPEEAVRRPPAHTKHSGGTVTVIVEEEEPIE
jgi:hypothetical protein